jgi:hypothetical protein
VDEVVRAKQCSEQRCTWRNEGLLSDTGAGRSVGRIAAHRWLGARVAAAGYIKVGSDTGFRVQPSAAGRAVEFASGNSRRHRAGPAYAPQLIVTYNVPAARPASGTPPASGPGPASGSGTPAANTGACAASLTDASGTPFCGAGGPAPAQMNVPLPANPALDPNSASMVAALNAGQHNADLAEFGTTVFDAGAGTQRSRIACTETDWGTCPLSGLSVPVRPAWRPSPGSDHAMVVVDYAARKVYDLWSVATNADGSIEIFGDGSIEVGWGGVTSLDGSGQSIGATGSGLSHLYGLVRIFEAQKAVDLGGCSVASNCPLAGAIAHALHFATDITCPTYRSPALKSDGSSSDPSCIPEGTRVFLDSGANCAFDSSKPIEEAVCFALKRYGAFATDTAGTRFAMGFEGDSSGQPGGSGPSPYAAGGLEWDYYDMSSIPWQHLHVVAG